MCRIRSKIASSITIPKSLFTFRLTNECSPIAGRHSARFLLRRYTFYHVISTPLDYTRKSSLVEENTVALCRSGNCENLFRWQESNNVYRLLSYVLIDCRNATKSLSSIRCCQIPRVIYEN